LLLLFPSHPLHPRRPDEHFAPEYDAARALGHDVALFDHDTLSVRRHEESALLRSWMLTADAYAELAARTPLCTTPAQYRRAHELPGWYDAFADLTPASVWGDLTGLPAGPGIVKDYVKSLKHAWDEAGYVPDVRAPDAVIARFLELRGEDLQGGVVLRRFESFAGPEARSWWVDGRCVLVTAHPDTPDDEPPDVPVAKASAAVAELDCHFITVDWAQRTDGTWRVIEVGDGQVSDRPQTTAPETLLSAL
jgi:hypothetical protein